MLDNGLGTKSKDPVWRKLYKTHQKSADHIFLDRVEFEKQKMYAHEICI